jgi:exodeoxyribonuclease VII small subunit
MAQAAIDLKDLSFEDALKELETLVKRLEAGDSTLDQAIEDYTRGTQLRSYCQQKLEDARLKVEKLTSDGQGGVKAVAFESGQE